MTHRNLSLARTSMLIETCAPMSKAITEFVKAYNADIGSRSTRVAFLDILHAWEQLQLDVQKMADEISAKETRRTLADTMGLNALPSDIARCPSGEQCQHELDWAHPCDRDENGNYECQRIRDANETAWDAVKKATGETQ